MFTFQPLVRRHKNLSNCFNLDPDENFYPDSYDCEYYIEDEFNDLLAKNSTPDYYLSLLHLNTRSLSRNFIGLNNLLANVNTKLSCIGISETWLQRSAHTCNISSYNFVHNFRSDRAGGGVGLYDAKELEFRIREDLDLNNKECAESLFVELSRPKEETNSVSCAVLICIQWEPCTTWTLGKPNVYFQFGLEVFFKFFF